MGGKKKVDEGKGKKFGSFSITAFNCSLLWNNNIGKRGGGGRGVKGKGRGKGSIRDIISSFHKSLQIRRAEKRGKGENGGGEAPASRRQP